MADHVPTSGLLIERGVAALLRWLKDGAAFLKKVPPRNGEAVGFEYALPADYTGTERIVRLAFPVGFPRQSLRMIIEPSPWLIWPHAMANGLCLFGRRQRPVSGAPEEVVDECMRRLGQLVALAMPGSDPALRQREFDDEITSYWGQQLSPTATQVVLIQKPHEATPLSVLTDTRSGRSSLRTTVWLAQDAARLSRHWKRMTGLDSRVRAPAAAAFYLPLASMPSVRVPSAGDVRAWLAHHVSEGDSLALRRWHDATASFPERWLVLQLPAAENPQHFMLMLRGAGTKHDGKKTYGRRAERRTVHRSSDKSMSKALKWGEVHILDREQVHSRVSRQEGRGLHEARVVLVGVGSLGSAIAAQLARVGVGHLTLVDPELLEDANLGRHMLGIDDLGCSKAIALRDRLRRDVPTAEVEAIAEFVQDAYAKHSGSFERADLVVVTTADWPSELALWGAKAEGTSWTFVQAWSEPHAEIGHALLAPPGAHDGRALFGASGRFRFRFSEWPDDGIRALPGCGASYIPGGPVAMAAIATMVSQVIIRALARSPLGPAWYTSVGDPAMIAAAGGTYGGPSLPQGATQIVLTRPWPDAADGAL